MSIVKTQITLVNKGDAVNVRRGLIKEDEIRQMTVEATVDTGAWTLIINEEIRDKLGLDDEGYGEANFANGVTEEHPLAGPVEIRWKNRKTVCNALVLPGATEILLGKLPLEDMDLTINPKRELVGVHGDVVVHRV